MVIYNWRNVHFEFAVYTAYLCIYHRYNSYQLPLNTLCKVGGDCPLRIYQLGVGVRSLTQ
ncbi:MAG: hypothetical protein ACYTX0_36545 [Nostoc sp.]